MSIWRLMIAQLKIYMRDRQSVFFALFFPLVFMLALGYGIDRGIGPLDVAVVPASPQSTTGPLVQELKTYELIHVTVESEARARRALDKGERDIVLFLPGTPVEGAQVNAPIPLRVLVNAAQPQQARRALTVLKGVLGQIEHDIRHLPPLFKLDVQDVRARNARYVDFLIPGLLAFMVLQLSIAGSGFNIVEYKRKGILKRLFVTPLRPSEFIASLIAARLTVIIVQISLLLGIGFLVFDVSIHGSILLLYLFVVAGGILFLSIGFTLGGIANTQSAIMALGNLVIFPQIMVAGVFFPLSALPAWLRPVASVLPLSFLSDALRRIGNDGAGITDLGTDVLGLIAWGAIGAFLAIRFFRWSDVAGSSA
ncbi:MAG: ABC transporter permease [Arenicellales bacterium]